MSAPDERFRPLPEPKRAAHFAWGGKVVTVNLDTKTLNCPACGMRMYLPHSLLSEDGRATVAPSVVCPAQHGGCGWHVVITEGTAI